MSFLYFKCIRGMLQLSSAMYLALLIQGPGQCVILCIIVNFTVIVELSDFNLALGLLICFFKRKQWCYSYGVFVCILQISQVEILIVTVVKVFSYWVYIQYMGVCFYSERPRQTQRRKVKEKQTFGRKMEIMLSINSYL